MKRLYTFGEIKQLLNAKSENIDTNSLINGFSINSRTLKKGDLFFCIKGENADAHEYIPEALKRGACAVVANAKKIPLSLKKIDFPKLLVSDPNLALREWSADFRKQFKGKVLAVTGSNGKTSTKEILKCLCSFSDSRAYSTPGNFNNFFGVPMTLLNADLDAKWWIVEIGTNQFGEIAELSKIVQPTAGVITNVGESHLEFLKSTQGVAREKSGLFAGMQPGSNIVFPDSIMHQEIFEEKAREAGLNITKSFFKYENLSDDKFKFRLFNTNFETSINSPIMLQNLILALTILYLEGVSLRELVKAASVLDINVKGRFNQMFLEDWILVDDTYNANPTSFQNVLENLNEMYPDRRKIVVCGKMAELGDSSYDCHLKVGENMVKNGISFLFGLGGNEIEFYLKGWLNGGGESKSAKNFSELRELILSFKEVLKKGDVVLVKGSRSSRMERFVKAVT